MFDSPTKKSKEKVNIINQMNNELDKYSNIKYLFLNAPHQIERTMSIYLSNLIINEL